MLQDNVQRRPLKSRETKWADFLSKWLLRKGFKPNQISIASIFSSVLAGFCLVSINSLPAYKFMLYILAAVFIQLRLLCNLLDGMMAIEGGLKAKTGNIFNDFPDRIADMIILVSAGFSISSRTIGIHLGWLAAALAIMTAYVRLLGGSLGVRQYFSGPMAKPHRMATLTIACLLSAASLTFHKEDYIMVIALSLIVFGCIITMVRRTSMIVKELRAS